MSSGYPYGSGFHYELSRGRRLLTGAMIGMVAGVCLGYLLGRYAPGSDPQWPARFECRDLTGNNSTAVRICTLERLP